MEQAYLTAFFALGGTLMGALASFAGIWLAQRQETSRAIRHELIAAATKCWEVSYFHSLNVTGEPLLPIDDYIIDFLTLENIISRVGKIEDDELLKFLKLRDKRFEKITAYRNSRHKNHSGASVPSPTPSKAQNPPEPEAAASEATVPPLSSQAHRASGSVAHTSGATVPPPPSSKTSASSNREGASSPTDSAADADAT